MESSSESNKIQVSGSAAKKLMRMGYKFTFRGSVTVKVNEKKKFFDVGKKYFNEMFLLPYTEIGKR